MGDVVQEDTSLKEQGRVLLLWRPMAARQAGHAVRLLLQNRVALSAFPVIRTARRARHDFLAAQDNLLEEEHVILAVDVHLHDHEDVVEDELAEIGQMMAFPVFDARLETRYRLLVLRSSLRLVDAICDALRSFETLLEFVIEWVIGRPPRGLQ